MVLRVGHTDTLQPTTPTGYSWVDLHSGSSNNYGEYGDTTGAHEAQGVWQFLRTTDVGGSVSVKTVLRDYTNGDYLGVSSAVTVTGSAGAWYYFPISGTFTTTTVAFFPYAESSKNLSQARTTTIGNHIKKHSYNSGTIYTAPTTAITSWADNNHNLYSYYEYEEASTSASITAAQTETGDTQAASLTLGAASATITASLIESGDSQAADIIRVLLDRNISVGQTESGDTQTASIQASVNSADVNIAPKAGWSYVNITSLAGGGLLPVSPALQVGDQVYGETNGGAVTYNADGTTTLSSAPQTVNVQVHDGTSWLAVQTVTLELIGLVSSAQTEAGDGQLAAIETLMSVSANQAEEGDAQTSNIVTIVTITANSLELGDTQLANIGTFSNVAANQAEVGDTQLVSVLTQGGSVSPWTIQGSATTEWTIQN